MLFLEYEVHRQDQQAETDEMVVGEGLVLEEQKHEDGEDCQRQELLDHLELPKVERASVVEEADPVGRHHEAILDKGDAPAEQDDQWQR